MRILRTDSHFRPTAKSGRSTASKLLRQTNPWTPAPMEDWFGKAFADFGDLTRWIGRADPFERFSRPHLSADLFEDDLHAGLWKSGEDT